MTLTERMGQLLGPRAVQEIVITRYADNTINYQIEGMNGPVPPQDAYHMLGIVANEVVKVIAQQPAPAPAPTTPQEVPHE